MNYTILYIAIFISGFLSWATPKNDPFYLLINVFTFILCLAVGISLFFKPKIRENYYYKMSNGEIIGPAKRDYSADAYDQDIYVWDFGNYWASGYFYRNYVFFNKFSNKENKFLIVEEISPEQYARDKLN